SSSCPTLGGFPVVMFNTTSTSRTYTLSLHDALPISLGSTTWIAWMTTSMAMCRTSYCSFIIWKSGRHPTTAMSRLITKRKQNSRSEEHTSELQSRFDLVCRLLLEKKKNVKTNTRLNK